MPYAESNRKMALQELGKAVASVNKAKELSSYCCDQETLSEPFP